MLSSGSKLCSTSKWVGKEFFFAVSAKRRICSSRADGRVEISFRKNGYLSTGKVKNTVLGKLLLGYAVSSPVIQPPFTTGCKRQQQFFSCWVLKLSEFHENCSTTISHQLHVYLEIQHGDQQFNLKIPNTENRSRRKPPGNNQQLHAAWLKMSGARLSHPWLWASVG